MYTYNTYETAETYDTHRDERSLRGGTENIECKRIREYKIIFTFLTYVREEMTKEEAGRFKYSNVIYSQNRQEAVENRECPISERT